MEQSFDFSSYNNIKRLPENELNDLWNRYLSNKSDKHARDEIIVQYIYLVRYVVGRVKVSLPATISIEDIAGYGVEGLINAVERFSPQKIQDLKLTHLSEFVVQLLTKSEHKTSCQEA